jgi:hypothetical protein
MFCIPCFSCDPPTRDRLKSCDTHDWDVIELPNALLLHVQH